MPNASLTLSSTAQIPAMEKTANIQNRACLHSPISAPRKNTIANRYRLRVRINRRRRSGGRALDLQRPLDRGGRLGVLSTPHGFLNGCRQRMARKAPLFHMQTQ
jgi:hypothetical protein